MLDKHFGGQNKCFGTQIFRCQQFWDSNLGSTSFWDKNLGELTNTLGKFFRVLETFVEQNVGLGLHLWGPKNETKCMRKDPLLCTRFFCLCRCS